MAQTSAGVQVKEIDLSIVVPSSSNSVAAFGGEFSKGPVDVPVLITNVDDFETIYGKPTMNNYNDWYQVYNFLQYANKIYVSRAFNDTDMKNASGEIDTSGVADIVPASNFIIKNDDDYELTESNITYSDNVATKFVFTARTPGTHGNDLRVVVANEAAMSVGTTELYTGAGLIISDLFDANIDQTNGEIAVVVLDGTVVVEKWIVSVDEDALDTAGKSAYIEKVINRKSQYIYVKDNTALTYPVTDVSVVINDTTLTGGADGTIYDVANTINKIVDTYDVFSNKEEIEVDLIIANERAHTAAATLAGNRRDCIAFLGGLYEDCVGVPTGTAVSNIIQYATIDFNIGDAIGKYASFFGNYKNQYSSELDAYIWINVAGDIAGLRAATNSDRFSWFASAGIERGNMKNTVKIAFNPNQGYRDQMYKNMVNPIVAFTGQGNSIVWGQKTLQSKPSAFDRINVRGLFNEMERAIEKMAKYYVFENNDHFTRTRFKSTIEPYLREIKANGGIYDFYVLCDDTNNTPQVIDTNRFIASIAVKPTKTAEFLELNFIAVGTGVDFKEIFTK